MKLIMNADDFGYTRGVSDGIVYACRHGIIRSTTAMCNMPALDYAAELKRECPQLGVGIHLTISAGDPILKTHKALVDSEGHFFKKSSVIRQKKDIDIQEVYAEFEAQMNRFIEAFGCLPDHIDGHHGCLMFDHIWPATEKLAKKYQLRVRRMEKTIPYYDYFYKENVTFELFKLVIEKYQKEGAYALEIGCHPGFVDYDLVQDSSYNVERIRELQLMVDPALREYLDQQAVELASYSTI